MKLIELPRVIKDGVITGALINVDHIQSITYETSATNFAAKTIYTITMYTGETHVSSGRHHNDVYPWMDFNHVLSQLDR